MDFADDIFFLSNEIQQAKQLLHRVETKCGEVVLGLNVKMTKVMFFNFHFKPLTTIAGHASPLIMHCRGEWRSFGESILTSSPEADLEDPATFNEAV